jgi:small subunit ribosomal protein S16
VAVKIRLKLMGRKHRPFYRICAMDVRQPRGGRVIEELGTYDPLVPDTDARVVLNGERLTHWLKVGAQPTEKVKVLIKKYGPEGTHVDAMRAARERLALPRAIPDPGEPAVVPQPKKAEESPAPEEVPVAAEASE